jgi:hypothetical protein
MRTDGTCPIPENPYQIVIEYSTGNPLPDPTKSNTGQPFHHWDGLSSIINRGNCQLFRQWLPLLCFRRLIETHHKALDIPAPFFYIMISCLANHDTIAERAAQETVRVNRLPTEAHLEARQIPVAVASGILQLYQGC